ncbi:hypothetical protein AAFF_G00284720 [Aldrovandia affinis]|uniref:Cholesterol side-chain cleavage enzyme, mitochondrial n=1 Tax=Aldrovandia affinis TaxID=143900 RepID=A0AAD7TAA3_9TELE|nr:hypothetical protein AAFF_G00284720 [Aldrovandia affinis]
MIGSWRLCSRSVALCRSPWSLYGDGGWGAPARGFHSASVSHGTNPDSSQGVRPFDDMPGMWKNSTANLFTFWKRGGLENSHEITIENFKTFGPIYREKLGTYESVNIISPDDGAILFKAEGFYPERLTIEAWRYYRKYRNYNNGVMLKSGKAWRDVRITLNKEVLLPAVQDKFVHLLDEVGQSFVKHIRGEIERSGENKWTIDLTQDLFKFALESIGFVLYGQRFKLLEGHIEPETQHFINCIAKMFSFTRPFLYIPPWLLHYLGTKAWKDYLEAWDGIFDFGDRCIQKIEKQIEDGLDVVKESPGVLTTLLMQGNMSVDDIRASITELMAGGVDTTSITLLWTLYELAKQPSLQEELRAEIAAARKSTQGDLVQMLKIIPLVKGCLKETLRIHPIAVNLQRYTTEDIVIQNYHIPSGTLVQLNSYAMGRDPQYFRNPEKYIPSRWLEGDSRYFRNVGFGFGPRQCIGRRIAETEMQLCLIHMLENFRFENSGKEDVQSTFSLILIPGEPIILTMRPL